MIKKNENLTDKIQVPLISLVCGFKIALQKEEYELCGRIKLELDRRERLYGINKKILIKILDCIGEFPDEDSPENKKHFYDVFEKYL